MGNDQHLAAVIDALNSLEIPYMLVGSYSSNVFGVARATKDADLVVELGQRRIGEIARLIGPGFRLQEQLTFETITGTVRYIIDVVDDPFRIELFRLSNDPHDQSRFCRRQEVEAPALGRRVFLPTPEDIIVTKLRWSLHSGRGKDRDDARDVIAVQGERLDFEYIHRWADEHGTRELLDDIRRSIPPI
jgi:hypothetical protein